MNDVQWEAFIRSVVQKGKKCNLKQICQEKQVGLNTLYRKVRKLREKNLELYDEFISLHPYKPRDTQGIDFEQLMREAILTGISQNNMEKKYNVSKRTIQRKFAKIEQDNFYLYRIYQLYIDATKNNQQLDYRILEEVASEYVPQQIKSEYEKLECRRNQFIQSLKETENAQTRKHYQEEIQRVTNQIEKIRAKGR